MEESKSPPPLQEMEKWNSKSVELVKKYNIIPFLICQKYLKMLQNNVVI